MQNFNVMIYPAKDGTFLATYLHPLSNDRVRKVFSNLEAAEAYKDNIELKFLRADAQDYRVLNVEDLVILFQNEHPESNFSGSKLHIRDFIETFGKSKVDELSSKDFKSWMEAIQIENNLKEITMRGLKSDLEVFFRFAINKEIISESPLNPLYFKKTTPDINTRNLLTLEQIDEILQKTKEYSPGYLYPILRIFVETAAKPTDIFALLWKNVDLEKKQLKFVQMDKCQERTLPMSEELTSILEKKKKAGGLVFQTYYKEPFTKNKLSALVNEFKIKGNCKIKWTPMDLRHSFAVNFLLKGGDIRRLQYILGHWNIYDTKKMYGAVTTSRAEKTAASPFEIGSLAEK